MTIEVSYEAHRVGVADAKFTLDPEEEAAFLALPEGEQTEYLRHVCNQHAYFEDDWDDQIERTDIYRVLIDGADA
jgi:hypothetical protein